MKVLSLFDGISCGMVALEKAGIPVERYIAYEIDKYAIKVSEKNYPQIEHKGDVFKGDYTEYKGFDLLLGGSPCTFWSIAQTKERETTPDGEGGKLFMEYVRALKESECKYFLYENNYSINRNIKDFISEKLGVQPIMINSSLISAQSRKRYYWTNIPNVNQLTDRGIKLVDILEGDGECIPINPIEDGKAHTLPASYYKTGRHPFSSFGCERNRQRIGVKIDKNKTEQFNKDVTYVTRFYDKSYDVKNGMIEIEGERYPINLPNGKYQIRKLTPLECERLQTLPDNYTKGVSNTQRYKSIGNGWTVDVIAHILKGLKVDN